MSQKHLCYVIDDHFEEIRKDLKPCPICGAKTSLIFPMRYYLNQNHSRICCTECNTYSTGSTMAEAISNWNNEYIICFEDENGYDMNYLDDDSAWYFENRILKSHPFDGTSIYAY